MEPSFPSFTATSGTLVRACAQRWGDKPFVTLGDRCLTYAEADARSAELAKGLLVSALILLALVKAALVGLFYMHLVHETNVLKWSVAIPMATPVLYALVLIAEASWRLS